MAILIKIFWVVLTFFFMEGVAWFTHKYVMHGFLWNWHRDHHQPHTKHGWFERNDLFFLVFAIPSATLFMVGSTNLSAPYLWMGLGILLYGLAYFFVHDIFIHQRFPPLLKYTNHNYFKAIRKGHKVHHKKMHKEDGECFGMLWVPFKYFKEVYKNQSSGKK